MNTELLKKAYEAIEMLKALNLPVSEEQMSGVAKLEKEYLRDEIIPHLKQELEPFVSKLRGQLLMRVTFEKTDGLNIQLVEHKKIAEKTVDGEDGYRKKKSYIRVTFPDKRVSFNKKSSDTFFDVIKYAGAKNVERMGFDVLGMNLVSDSLFENAKYKKYQREVEPGLYVCTYCNTQRKLKILKEINRQLKLNLIIEEVMMED